MLCDMSCDVSCDVMCHVMLCDVICNVIMISCFRFVYVGMWRQKVNTHVDYPINDLSLNNFVIGPTPSKFQLYGVSVSINLSTIYQLGSLV